MKQRMHHRKPELPCRVTGRLGRLTASGIGLLTHAASNAFPATIVHCLSRAFWVWAQTHARTAMLPSGFVPPAWPRAVPVEDVYGAGPSRRSKLMPLALLQAAGAPATGLGEATRRRWSKAWDCRRSGTDLSPAGSLEGHEVPLEKGAGLASSFCTLAKASNRGTLVVGHIQ